jgi:hypothetical protein
MLKSSIALGFFMKVDETAFPKTLESRIIGIENANNALEKLVDSAVQKTANGIRLKISIIITVIASIFAVLAIIATHAIGGNIMIPIAIFAILIANKVSGIIFKEVEEKISKFATSKGE